jgi:hypothetical protein
VHAGLPKPGRKALATLQATSDGGFLEIDHFIKYLNKAKAELTPPEPEHQVSAETTTTTTTLTSITVATPSTTSTSTINDSNTSSTSRATTGSSGLRSRKWVPATNVKASEASSDEGDGQQNDADADSSLAEQRQPSTPVAGSDDSWAPTAETLAEAFAGDSTVSRIKRAVAETLLQVQPPCSRPWGQVVKQVGLLQALRLQEQQAVRGLLASDPRFTMEDERDVPLLSASVGLSCDPAAWPGKPDIHRTTDQLQRACQVAFNNLPQEPLLMTVSAVILEQAPITFSMRWTDIQQALTKKGKHSEVRAYVLLSEAHPAFKYSINDAGIVSVSLVPDSIKRQLRVRSNGRQSPEAEQQHQQQQQQQHEAQEQEVQALHQVAPPSPQHETQEQEGQHLQHQQQQQQHTPIASPDPELMQALAAAFPGSTLAAQIMREAAELVVARAPQKLIIKDTLLLQLCKEQRKGWDRVPKEQRASWRQAVTHHPAWQLQPPTRPGADITWVLDRQEVLRLAADPLAAKVAAAEVTLVQQGIEEATYLTSARNRYKTLALNALVFKGEGASEEVGRLTSAILEQDRDMWSFFTVEVDQPEGQALEWLNEDPRFEVADSNRSSWGARTLVRLRSTDPPAPPAPLGLSPVSDEVTSGIPAATTSTVSETAEHQPATQPSTVEGAVSAAAAQVRSTAAELLLQRPGGTAQFSWLVNEMIASGIISDTTTSKRKRGEVARAWLAADPLFKLWEDEAGNLHVALKSASLLGVELRMLLNPDGTARLIPPVDDPRTGNSAAAQHGAGSSVTLDADMKSFLALLPNRWASCLCSCHSLLKSLADQHALAVCGWPCGTCNLQLTPAPLHIVFSPAECHKLSRITSH